MWIKEKPQKLSAGLFGGRTVFGGIKDEKCYEI
jgi:hypothetical protein